MALLCPLRYRVIQALEQICTSIIDRYLVNIHKRLQHYKEIGALRTADNACRKYVQQKVCLEFSSMVTIFLGIFNHFLNFCCPCLTKNTPCPRFLSNLGYLFVGSHVKATWTSNRPVGSANVAQMSSTIISNFCCQKPLMCYLLD